MLNWSVDMNFCKGYKFMCWSGRHGASETYWDCVNNIFVGQADMNDDLL